MTEKKSSLLVIGYCSRKLSTDYRRQIIPVPHRSALCAMLCALCIMPGALDLLPSTFDHIPSTLHPIPSTLHLPPHTQLFALRLEPCALCLFVPSLQHPDYFPPNESSDISTASLLVVRMAFILPKVTGNIQLAKNSALFNWPS